MIDLLVVSHACATATNRAPYRVLAAQGWNVEIATAARLALADITRESDPPAPDDPPMHYLPLHASTPRFWHFDGLSALIDARRPRIVLLDYDPGTRLGLDVGSRQRRQGGRTVCFSYDNIARTVLGELRRAGAGAAARVAVVRAMSLLARPFVDHVFVLSNDSASVIADLGFAGRVSKIPLGFEPAVFRPDAAARARVRRELGLRDTTFAYFGRLVPEKGVHLLIRALHGLRERPWQLLLDQFGEYPHPYEQELQALIAELGLQDRVVFFDAPHSAVANYMNAADVVIVPSIENARWKEQYGRVAPEAMACGKLVIVTDSGALKELVGDAGIIVKHSDVSALAAALSRVLDDPSIVERGAQKAIDRALGHLSLPVQCDRMREVFEKWVAPSRAEGRGSRAEGRGSQEAEPQNATRT